MKIVQALIFTAILTPAAHAQMFGSSEELNRQTQRTLQQTRQQEQQREIAAYQQRQAYALEQMAREQRHQQWEIEHLKKQIKTPSP